MQLLSDPQETVFCNEDRGKSCSQRTASLCRVVLSHFVNKKYPKACGGVAVTSGDKEGL